MLTPKMATSSFTSNDFLISFWQGAMTVAAIATMHAFKHRKRIVRVPTSCYHRQKPTEKGLERLGCFQL